MRRLRPIIAALVATAATLAFADDAFSATEPWKAASDARSGLRAAGIEVLTGDERAAAAEVREARAAYVDGLEEPHRRSRRQGRPRRAAALDDAEQAARDGDVRALAAARGAFARCGPARLGRGDAVGHRRGEAAVARRWLLLRDFRTATRFTRPGADATLAIERLGEGKIAPKAAHAAVVKDLLDGYQARMRELLDDANAAAERGFATRQAEAAAQAAGYWRILRERYVQDRGEAAAERMTTAVDALAIAAAERDQAHVEGALRRRHARARQLHRRAVHAPEAARRAQQLLRFLALVPVEYDRGVSGTKVTLDFEIQEAVAFRTGAAAAFTDLARAARQARRRARRRRSPTTSTSCGRCVGDAAERKDGVPEAGEVEAVADRAEAGLDKVFPKAWKEATDESDYDLIALTLDRMEAAVGAAEYKKAEQARLEAYAFFEFGPERRLKAFDPGLAIEVEGLIWFGARDQRGSRSSSPSARRAAQVHETRLVLD